MSQETPKKEKPRQEKPRKEKPKGDLRQRTDWGSHCQTHEPWKGNPEKEQRPSDRKPDLEKWHESNTH